MKLLIPISLALFSVACLPHMQNRSKSTNCINCTDWTCATCDNYKFVHVECGRSRTATLTPSTFPVPQGEQFSWRGISPLDIQFQGNNPCDPFDKSGKCKVEASPGSYSYQVSVSGCPNPATGIIQVTPRK